LIWDWLTLAVLVLVMSWVGTGWMRQHALRTNLLDIPNDRSSHKQPTPRGGGLAIAVAASVGFATLFWLGQLNGKMLLALLLGGGAIALVGMLDDRHKLSPSLRLSIHLAAAALAIWCLGGIPPLQVGERVVDLGAPGWVLGVLAIVWTLNLFNFMDGIDGIAASESTFMAVIGGILLLLAVPDSSLAGAAFVFGAACLGFLAWNWPPAKIFMGDVGSGYLGYVLAVLALGSGVEHPAAGLAWLILGGLFFADATVTLLRRVVRQQRVFDAHREHAYQHVAIRRGSHRAVTLAVWGINLCACLPLAYAALRWPAWAAWIASLAVAGAAVAAASLGAGTPASGAGS
jgi:Fuc2NAc and GlcNAc transferase